MRRLIDYRYVNGPSGRSIERVGATMDSTTNADTIARHIAACGDDCRHWQHNAAACSADPAACIAAQIDEDARIARAELARRAFAASDGAWCDLARAQEIADTARERYLALEAAYMVAADIEAADRMPWRTVADREHTDGWHYFDLDPLCWGCEAGVPSGTDPYTA